MRTYRVTKSIAGLLVLVGAIAAGALSASAGTNAAAGNEAVARTDAAALLARLKLPAGSVSSVTEPSGGGAALAHPALGAATPNVVDDHGFWVVPGSPTAVLAYIKEHPPAGGKLVETGSGNAGAGFRVFGYAWPARVRVLSSRQLVVDVVSLGDHRTALRADALDVWMKPRPVSERIPRKADRLRVTVVNGKRTVQGPLTFTLARQVRRVRSVIDGLPAAQPGVEPCPADFAIRVQLAFYAADATRPVAVASVDPDGCEGVGLTVNGRRQMPLTGEAFPGSGRVHLPPLTTQLGRILGVKLAVGGP